MDSTNWGWLQGRGAAEGSRRIEIRNVPRWRPTSWKRPKLLPPPVLEIRAGLPPVKSATSGARLRASSPTFEVVPRTCTVSVRCSPGASGDESAASDSATNVIEKEELERLAQATSTMAGPDSSSAGGSATSVTGEDASTSAGFPATRTVFASASPQKPLPESSNRSASEAKRGAEETCREEDPASAGIRMVV